MPYMRRPTTDYSSQNDPFRAMFNEVADLASVLVDNVVITYDGKRIYPSASPHGIGIWSEAELGRQTTTLLTRYAKRVRPPSDSCQQMLATRSRMIICATFGIHHPR